MSPLGLEVNGIRDRMWMVMSDNHKLYVDIQYVHPLVTLHPESPCVTENELIVRNGKDPSKPPLKIPIFKDIPEDADVKETKIYRKCLEGLYTGDDVSKLLREYTGRDDIIIIQSIEHLKEGNVKRKTYHTYNSYHMITMPSVCDLNKRLEKKASYKNFRPNIIIDGDNMEPFEDDKWKYVKIGDAEFEFASFCDRCPIVNVDPETGDYSPKVMEALRKYRLATGKLGSKFGNAPLFGTLHELRAPGTISVGDPVYAYYD
ncbi:mitochondrial amidoxime reducing component 2-like [Centruroides vittatus]|uniref:mitochondrial amidoxime reducing component 2-like n=1 Tax=Centruroides vittatus TaxID=120091 RepID=UPI00350EACE0